MYEVESVEYDDHIKVNDPLLPGHLIVLDGPNLGTDRKVTPYIYQRLGRIGK